MSTTTTLSIAPPSIVTSHPTTSLTASFNAVRIHPSRPLRTPLSSRTRPSSVVMMANKRELELEEIRAKSTEEIEQEVQDMKNDLFVLEYRKGRGDDVETSDFNRLRKRVARMLTVRREREIENGIGKRLSRKLDKEWKKGIVPRPSPAVIKWIEEKQAAVAAEEEED